MKLVRTAQPHEAVSFGPDDDADLDGLEPEDVRTVNHRGIVVSDADAARYVKRGEVLGIDIVAEDAPEDGAESPSVAGGIGGGIDSTVSTGSGEPVGTPADGTVDPDDSTDA